MTKGTVYTFEQVALIFVRKAANYTAHRYRHYGVEADDVAQEIYVWLYSEAGKTKVDRWLGNSPQQTTRVYRSMLDKALAYAEGEKAARVGYKVDDVHWYTPSSVTGLMPLALDVTFVQEKGDIGDLITMVIDIRKALNDTGTWDYFLEHNDGDDSWHETVQVVIDKLGGDRPYVGRRKAMSNSRAQAITRDSE